MLQTYNMKLFRRAGLSLSILLVPALVLNPTPSSARVLDPGSRVTSWGTNGVVEHWETGPTGSISMPWRDVYQDEAGRYVFATSEFKNGSNNTITSVRSIETDGSIGYKYDLSEQMVDYGYVYDFDIDANGKYLVVNEVSQTGEIIVVRTMSNGTHDVSFSGDGNFDLESQINLRAGNASNCIFELNFLDFVTDPNNGSSYVLGSIFIAQKPSSSFCSTQSESNKLRVWKITPNGTLDTTFGTDSIESFPIIGGTQSGTLVTPSSDSARMAMHSNENLTIVSRASVGGEEGIFHQEIDITTSVPQVIPSNGRAFNYKATEASRITDFAFQSSFGTPLWIVIVADNCDESCTSSSLHILNWYANSWFESPPDSELTFWDVAVGGGLQIYVSAESRAGHRDQILKFSAYGVRNYFFTGPQGSFGHRTSVDYAPGSLFFGVDSSPDNSYSSSKAYVTAIGQAVNFMGNPETTFVYGSKFYLSQIAIPDPPAPAPAPVSAPATVVAPVLPTQSAPVSVPATVKAKKNLNFPLKSRAGNALSVFASGSCKVSPVFKKVKVKVGKKTKKVKQQTGWTVQIKKKKKTCTITQTDAGGNGYAALSSTSTVTIK